MNEENYIKKLKHQAISAKIPIIEDDVAHYLTTLIKDNKIKSVLEIGTASSYSAHVMAIAGATVETIERNEKCIQLARKNIQHSPLKSQIKLYEEDAINIKLRHAFDLIFIDGAKSKYQLFFEKFHPLLSRGGYIICDNMFFHHLKPEDVRRNTRRLLKKLKAFEHYLLNHPHFETEILQIGDGLSISRRINE